MKAHRRRNCLVFNRAMFDMASTALVWVSGFMIGAAVAPLGPLARTLFGALWCVCMIATLLYYRRADAIIDAHVHSRESATQNVTVRVRVTDAEGEFHGPTK